jgi:hypothetical protein
VIDWDGYRAAYDTMPFDAHQAFYADVARAHPVQRAFDPTRARNFFEYVHDEMRAPIVEEIGGWDGALAALILDFFPTFEWVNWEIAPGVADACQSSRYRRVTVDDWPWRLWEFGHGDVLVLSHVIEHMSVEHVRQLMAETSASFLYVDAPIDWERAPDWDGYVGSHVLPLSYRELVELLREFNWAMRDADQSRYGIATTFKR